jgi:signal peptidase I
LTNIDDESTTRCVEGCVVISTSLNTDQTGGVLERSAGDGARALQPVTGRTLRRESVSRAPAPVDQSRSRSIIEWVLVLIAAAAAALLIRSTVVQVFFIPSESMANTLEVNDRVVVDKLSHRINGVHRGDIVVFHKPANLQSSKINDLVKRVIAVEGDTVEAVNGQVYVNDIALDEPYLVTQNSTRNLPKLTIGADQIFMMGDNRERSSDSRVFGPIDESTVVGHARMVISRQGQIKLDVL